MPDNIILFGYIKNKTVLRLAIMFCFLYISMFFLSFKHVFKCVSFKRNCNFVPSFVLSFIQYFSKKCLFLSEQQNCIYYRISFRHVMVRGGVGYNILCQSIRNIHIYTHGVQHFNVPHSVHNTSEHPLEAQ